MGALLAVLVLEAWYGHGLVFQNDKQKHYEAHACKNVCFRYLSSLGVLFKGHLGLSWMILDPKMGGKSQ